MLFPRRLGYFSYLLASPKQYFFFDTHVSPDFLFERLRAQPPSAVFASYFPYICRVSCFQVSLIT